MKSLFRLPGPTPLPPEVYAAMQRPMMPHRGEQFSSFYSDLLRRCQRIHHTENEVAIWPASGSAAWEIGLVNLVEAGEPVLSVSCGDFGDRFRQVARQLGYEVRSLDVEWGAAVEPAMLADALQQHPDVSAVLLTHNETSTGVTNPLPELAQVVRDHGALLLVDAVSSVAGLPVLVDEWGLDFVFSGSQKAWMCPPGLVIVAVSERGIEAASRTSTRRNFFDLETAVQAGRKGQTPSTPPLSLLYALDAAVRIIESEGLTAVWERHHRVAERLRTGLRRAGFELLPADQIASDTVTALLPPPGVTVQTLVRDMREWFGVTVAPGQGKMTYDIVRIGHMGWCDEDDIDACLAALNGCLSNHAPALMELAQ